MNDYKTVLCTGKSEIIEKKSRFLSFVSPVSCEDEALSFISKIKTDYPDATHHVYAYLCRQNNICRYSDDKEPSGTAGMPTLDAIRHAELCDIAVVTVRYFGGTLLGTGGLVRAYGKSAKEGILNAKPVLMVYSETFSVSIDYSLLGKVQYVAAENNFIIEKTEFGESVQLILRVPSCQGDYLKSKITESTLGKAVITKISEGFYPKKFDF